MRLSPTENLKEGVEILIRPQVERALVDNTEISKKIRRKKCD